MRKIKLMALLLAALMIVTAFAGCASVKQEDFDAVEDRVSAIEDLLKGQQGIISDLAGKVDANGNQEILDAIDSVKNDLEEKIESVNNRVDEVEKQEPTAGTTVTDATKAKQAEALASIEVQKATFSKNADEYDEATYAAITAAFGTAQAEVTAATTEAGVKAAMDKLAAALDTYKTYAMKLYDYYVALLGNVNEDAEELVDEVLDFIEVIDEVYEDLTDKEKIDELQYLVSKGTTASKNVYLDVYSSVVALCNIYAKTSGTYDVEYVNAKGKVVTATSETLNGFKKAAKALDKEIVALVGDEILYSDLGSTFEAKLEALQDKYEDYVDLAELIGGAALVDLVTKGDIIADAEAKVEALYEAKDAYDELNGRNKNGLYYYDELDAKVGLTFVDDDDDKVWYGEYYEEEITAVLDAWIEEYELSEDNVKAIIGETKYENYLEAAHVVALIAAAYEKFADEIVPAINDINKLSAGTADAVQEYKDLKDAIEELAVLQEADAKNDNDLLKPEIILPKAIFGQFIVESEVLLVSKLDTEWINGLEDEDDIAEADEVRLNAFLDGFTSVEDLGDAFVDLFTFSADIKDIERAGNDYFTVGADGKEAGKRTSKDAEVYTFFAVEYTKAEEAAKAINAVIEKLVEKVEDKKIGTNVDFITLAGEYINAKNDAIDDEWTFESADGEFDVKAGDNVYVAIEDAIDYEELPAGTDVKVTVEGKTVLTIDYFNFKYPVFEDLIDVADFEAAQKTLEARIVELFADIDELETLVDKVGYVRAGAYEYEDKDGNGKYDADKDILGAAIPEYTVSLNDKAAVEAAVAIYDAWVSNGGNERLAIFTELVNEETEKVYGGVYNMKGFDDADGVAEVLDTLRTLEKNIDKLVKLANKFVNGLKVVNSVNSYNSISVSESTNKLALTSQVQGLAVTKYAASSANDAVANKHGTWTYVYESTDGYLTTADKTFTTAMKYDDAAAFLKAEGVAAITKARVIEFMVTAYNNFYVANVEYTAASDNDYEEGDAVYYVNDGYAAYKAVDDAKASYDKFDLIAAQAACLVKLGNNSDSNDTTFKRQLLNAKSVAELDNIINNYNSVVEKSEDTAGKAITADDVKGWVIYKFDCLNYDIELQ